MLEIAAALLDRLDSGRSVAVATVTRVDGSAPRDLGTSMAVDDRGAIVGSISGGCVEGAVVEIAERVLASGAAELARFGISDETAFAVGLSCGGDIEVLVRPLDASAHRSPLESATSGRPAGIATVVLGPDALLGRDAGSLTDAELRRAGLTGITADRLRATAEARLRAGFTGRVPVQCDGAAVELFCESRLAPPRMLIYGAVDYGRALSDAAALLGYRVVVCDAREAFARSERFPSAAEVVAEWPDEHLAGMELDGRDVVVVLTHDSGFEVPLLLRALRSPAGYVGAMGSRRTHDRRIAALTDAGATLEELARLHSPIGLDLGAATPEETAVSILAELLADRTGASAAPLRTTSGSIHRRS
jgi:xanthine dehydrogenase accessory factor